MAGGVYSVAQVTAYIKHLFEDDYALSRVAVKGEISNCKYHSSGHIYFTLKDEKSMLACVMFSSWARGLSFRLEEGMQVVVRGSIRVFERDGRYQLYAEKIESEGEGALDHAVAVLPHEIQFLELMDGRRPDDEGLLCVGRNEVRTVVVMDADPFCGELRRQVRRGFVIAGHRVSLELEIPGQGAHPDASDAYEIYVLHLVISSLSRNLKRVYMLRRR